jgi:hypothetical protein
MEKLLYWSVRWPWIAGTLVFLGLTQLPLGPWYVSAWFVIGVALMTVVAARAEKARLSAAIASRRPTRIAPEATKLHP